MPLTSTLTASIRRRVHEVPPAGGGRGVSAARTGLVGAATVADTLGVSRDYVYRHARELGAVRLGTGEKARLRFDLEAVLAAVTAEPAARADTTRTHVRAGKRHPRQSTTTSGAPLLPVRGTRP